MTKKILIICLLFLLLGCKRVNNDDNYIGYVKNCLKHGVTKYRLCFIMLEHEQKKYQTLLWYLN